MKQAGKHSVTIVSK